MDGLVVRGEQLIIPLELQGEVIQLAHKGHQGQDKTLQQMRLSFPTWGPRSGSSWRVACHARQHRLGQRQSFLSQQSFPRVPKLQKKGLRKVKG